jgi:hypothetical protein
VERTPGPGVTRSRKTAKVKTKMSEIMNSIKCQSLQPGKNAWLKAVWELYEQEKDWIKV